MSKQIEQLRQYRYYLETHPTERLLTHQRDTLKRQIGVLEGRYSQWASIHGTKHKNPKTAYQTEVGMKQLRAQVRALNYLLEE